MKRKILVPMFASVMALSMNTVANADQVENNNENDKNSDRTLDLGEYQETTYKTAVVKDGVAVKIRNSGDVKTVAYTGDEFKVIGTQGEVSVGGSYKQEIFRGAGGNQLKAGDYMYRSGNITWDVESGMWGYVTVLDKESDEIEKL